jgi:2-amino-4-hydroxy-6-hydroxymethyldihydropteridine diphosphokinase
MTAAGPAGPGQPGPARAVLALGSNLGDRMAALQGAVDMVTAAPGIAFTAVSPVYRTAPAGGPEQPDYLNAVLLVSATAGPRQVLAAAHAAETAWQRTREVHWGPRTLDVDVIAYGDLVSADPVLTLPHPRAHERAFVLIPWHDVEPGAVLPGHGPVAALIAALGQAGVHRADGTLGGPVARETR